MNLHLLASIAFLATAPVLVSCEVVETTTPPAAVPQPPAPPAPDAPPQDQAAQQPAAGQQPQDDSYQDSDPSALTDFRGTLDPYGQWVDDPTYGTVWVPSSQAVGSDFTPYATAGHWTYDNDYVWESDYPWGWAPFHYGRWVSIEGLGWAWIPGRVYRGAWVTWGADPEYGYAGWYPASPEFVWRGGVAVGWTVAPVRPRWTYVPRGALFAPVLGARVVTGPAAVAISARVRPFVGTRLGVSGPPPASFGYNAAVVPHPSPIAMARAQQFAHPSTAVALGGHPPAALVQRRARASGGMPGGGSEQQPKGEPRAQSRGNPAPNPGQRPSNTARPLPAPRAAPRNGGNGHKH